MTMNELAILALASAYALVFRWGFRSFPNEHWQVLAAVPRTKDERGRWEGTNLTYYGVWTATAVVLAVAVLIVLLGSVLVPPGGIALYAATLLAVTVPAAAVLARLIEHKAHTFTIGGASFVGLLLAPWVILLSNETVGKAAGFVIPLPAALAALSIAYAFGEGTGRLACISFGCCYGQPLAACSPFVARLFASHHFVFTGPTKKAAYERGLDSTPLVPVQAITAVVCVAAGLGGLELFLRGQMRAAFLVSVLATQLWRAASEVWRADDRGGGRLSVYQVMALTGAVYAAGLALLTGAWDNPRPNLAAGLATFWHPAPILALQGLGFGLFLYTGRSKVTGSSISLHLRKEEV
jgi:hypothetical protein